MVADSQKCVCGGGGGGGMRKQVSSDSESSQSGPGRSCHRITIRGGGEKSGGRRILYTSMHSHDIM
jgi:hypothetical protein